MIAAWGESKSESSSDEESDSEVANLCFMANKEEETLDEVCLKTQHKEGVWYLDSGCSRHMTGDKTMFSTITPKDGGYVTFGDDKKGKIIGIGNIDY